LKDEIWVRKTASQSSIAWIRRAFYTLYVRYSFGGLRKGKQYRHSSSLYD
jgi:hypothetical protein